MTKSVVTTKHLSAFYAGTFLSQIGSYVFILGMLYYPALAGWTSFQIGLLLSASHLFVVLGTMLWGDLGDRVAPKKLLLFVEFMAMASSLIFIFCWSENSLVFRYLFIFFVGLRSLFLAIQAPSRNKYLKLVSGEYQKVKSLSILLTVTTQGTSIFSSILCLLFFNKYTFIASMLFDAFTFLVNGLIIFNLPEMSITPTQKNKLTQRFKTYLSVDKWLSFKDITASIAIAGISMLMVRLSASHRDLAFYLGGLFGLSFWIAGFLLHKIHLKNLDHYIWPLYGLMFALLIFATADWEKMLGLGLVFVMYAMLMHSYLARWQHESPVASISNIFSIRSIILTLTLGLGELLMGKLANVLALKTELAIRALFALMISFFIWLNRTKDESK